MPQVFKACVLTLGFSLSLAATAAQAQVAITMDDLERAEAERMWREFPPICKSVPMGKGSGIALYGCREAAKADGGPFPAGDLLNNLRAKPGEAISIAKAFFKQMCPLVEGEPPPICTEFAGD